MSLLGLLLGFVNGALALLIILPIIQKIITLEKSIGHIGSLKPVGHIRLLGFVLLVLWFQQLVATIDGIVMM